jgi:hypothetical protein
MAQPHLGVDDHQHAEVNRIDEVVKAAARWWSFVKCKLVECAEIEHDVLAGVIPNELNDEEDQVRLNVGSFNGKLRSKRRPGISIQ